MYSCAGALCQLHVVIAEVPVGIALPQLVESRLACSATAGADHGTPTVVRPIVKVTRHCLRRVPGLPSIFWTVVCGLGAPIRLLFSLRASRGNSISCESPAEVAEECSRLRRMGKV